MLHLIGVPQEAGDRDAQKQVAAKSGAHPERQTLSEKWGNWEEERGQNGKKRLLASVPRLDRSF